MTHRHATLIDPPVVRLYRWMTAAYPPAFRVTFGDSMVADFNDALRDALCTGRASDVTVLFARVGLDLLWSVTVQWARTSVPWLTMAYAMALICFCEGLATALMGGAFRLSRVMLMLPPVSAITFTLWFLVPHLRRHRSRTPCLKSVA
ncbi:MAG: hypothetical protein ABIP90_04100 [Vicinamibacterales bacterium]